MKTDRRYRLPDGSIDTDAIRYAEAWTEPAKVFNKAFGTRLIGFDPGFLIGYDGGSIDIPTWLMLKIVRKIQLAGEKH